MPVKKKVKPEPRVIVLTGKSPQQAIKHLKNMITHTPEPYKASLQIVQKYDYDAETWCDWLICK